MTRRAFTEDAPDDSGRRWKLIAGGLLLVGGGWTGIAHWAFAGSVRMTFANALLELIIAGIWSVRLAIHLRPRCRYYRRDARHIKNHDERRAHLHLNRLVYADAAVISIWTGQAIALMRYPDGWIQFLSTLAIVAAVVAIASATTGIAVVQLELPSGSEALERMRFIRSIMRLAARVPGVKRANSLFGNRTSFGSVSLLTLAVAAVLAAVIVLDTPPTAKASWHILTSIAPQNPSTWTTTTVATTTATNAATTTTTPTVTTRTTPTTPTTTAPTITTTTTQTPPDPCTTSPGVGAPATQRDAIHRKVFGDKDLQVDGYGENETGCLQRAKPVTDQPGLFIAAGWCGTNLRSVTIARADGSAATLLQQPAQFAYRAALEGTLVWASDRKDIGTGNLDVIDTTIGSFVFVRQQSAGEPIKPLGTLWCDQFTSMNVSYTRVPPGLVTLWLALIREAHDWVWAFEDAAHQGPGFSYLLQDDKTRKFIAQAHCRSLTQCTLTYEGRTSRFGGNGVVTSDELLEWAPPPATKQAP
jgi:hypothetical protein